MLEPKTQIFMRRFPRKWRSTALPDARMYGVRGWFSAHVRSFVCAPGHRGADAVTPRPSVYHLLLPDNPLRAETGALHRSRVNKPKGFRRPEPRIPGSSVCRPARWNIAGGEHAGSLRFLRRLRAKTGWADSPG